MPQRFLRPGVRSSKRWNRISWFEQTFYIRLITLVDDYGRYEADPELLQNEAFPYGDPDGKQVKAQTIAVALQTFAHKGLVIIYREKKSGKDYIQLERWNEKARSLSKFPDPANTEECDVLQAYNSNCLQLQAFPSKCYPPKPAPEAISPKPAPEAKGAAKAAPVGMQVQIPNSLNTPEFIIAWNKRMEHRRQKKRPMSIMAQEQALKNCAGWGVQKAIAAIETAIANDWQGLFEPRTATGNTRSPRPAEPNQLQETIIVKTL